MRLNRDVLSAAYSAMGLKERQALAKHMNRSMSQQYQYFLRPSSDSVGRERLRQLLEFMPEEKWLELAQQQTKTKTTAPIEININSPDLAGIPIIIVVNGQKHTFNVE